MQLAAGFVGLGLPSLGSLVSILLGVRLERSFGDLVSAALQTAVFVAVVRFMVVGSGAISWVDMGFGIDRRRVVAALFTGAVYALPIVVLTGLLSAIVVGAVGVTPESPLPPTGTALGLGLHLVAGAVIAPIGEEILFRGFAVTAWARSTGPTRAIVRAALLFAVAHVLTIGGDSFGTAAGLALVGTVARLPVALALGWLYVRSGTIWAPIGLHAAFNAILIVLGEMAVAGVGG